MNKINRFIVKEYWEHALIVNNKNIIEFINKQKIVKDIPKQ
jgi:hypothetical protein